MKRLIGGVAAMTIAACTQGDGAVGDSASALSGSGEILALGDSVTYGYNPNLSPEGAPFDRYKSYADELGGHLVNGACIGESSGSFLDASAPDNGCHGGENGESFLGWLKTPWSAPTQAEFVKSYLAHANPQLIVMTLGGNDIFLAVEDCGTFGCVGAVLAAAREFGEHMKAIFRGIAAAGYQGKIVVPNIYAPDYGATIELAGLAQFNSALESAANEINDGRSGVSVAIADVYSAWKEAAKGGSSCEAGLLLPAPKENRQGDEKACDVHPSAAGHHLIAEAVRATGGQR